MSLQHHYQGPAALRLQDNFIYLAPDGVMRPHAKTAELIENAANNPELKDGRMLALHQVNVPQDVHYPSWEMHPEGDELLILVSGSLSVELREGEKDWTAPLPAQAAFIVSLGIWHRLIVHAPSMLIAITPRHNTVHKSG